MLINMGDGTFTGGPLDVLLVLRNQETGRFHVSFVAEHLPPGPVKDSIETEVVRLRADMTHTAGVSTFEQAQAEIDAMRAKITLRDQNVVRDGFYEWNGVPLAMLANNWLREGKSFADLYPPTPTPITPAGPTTADSLLAAGGLPLE